MALLILDTNHVTYLLERRPGVVARYREALLANHEMLLSVVSYYEILRGLKEQSPPDELATSLARLRLLTSHWRRLSISPRSAEFASDVWVVRRQRGQRRPDDGDALLIGQARQPAATLVTNDQETARDAQLWHIPVENWY